MMKGRLFLANFVGVLVIVALVLGGFYYYTQSSQYIKTEDARVAGDMMAVTAPAAGKLSSWNGKEGAVVTKNGGVGRIDGDGEPLSVVAPIGGTIVKNEAREGQAVQPGQALAEVIDMHNLYVLANIDETDIKDIEIGSSVDVTVDGDPGTIIKGKVEEIGYVTNSVFSLLPTSNTSGNYSKVTQKVQVKISITNYSDTVLPGMNAKVVIAKK